MPRDQQSTVEPRYAHFGVLWLLALGLCIGCYDGELLVHEARSTALNTRLAEVDLGRYLTTMPRDQKNSSFTELELHVFCTVPRSRVAAVKSRLDAEEYRLRHDTLAAIRGATSEELAEPSLTQLRSRIEGVVNAILTDTPVKSIGFYQIAFRRR
ncbi:MAG: hypothetical protein WD738_08620 [Pirellulales bacterium]